MEFDRGRLGRLLSAVIEFWKLGGTNSGGGTGSAMFNIAEWDVFSKLLELDQYRLGLYCSVMIEFQVGVSGSGSVRDATNPIFLQKDDKFSI
jgi:hypothetical protein